MIEIRNLSFAYGKQRILDDVSFAAQSGECVAILGNNGAGKSTLITCLNGILTPQSGEVLIDGVPVRKMSRGEMARTIGYVAQKNEMTHAAVFDCVLLGRRPYIKWGVGKEDIALCESVIRLVGLEDFALRSLDELSGGELQKVMLARALVQQPKVLLLDEPTSNLDPRNQYEMMALVQKIAREQGITVLVVMHDLNLALRYCDRFYFLKDRRGYSYGGMETVTGEVLQSVYGIRAEIADISGTRVVVLSQMNDGGMDNG